MTVTFQPCTKEGNFCSMCKNAENENRYVCHVHNDKEHLHHVIHEKCAKILTKANLDNPTCVECRKPYSASDIFTEGEMALIRAEDQNREWKIFTAKLVRELITTYYRKVIILGACAGLGLSMFGLKDCGFLFRYTAASVAALGVAIFYRFVDPLPLPVNRNLEDAIHVISITLQSIIPGVALYDFSSYLFSSFHPNSTLSNGFKIAAASVYFTVLNLFLRKHYQKKI